MATTSINSESKYINKKKDYYYANFRTNVKNLFGDFGSKTLTVFAHNCPLFVTIVSAVFEKVAKRDYEVSPPKARDYQVVTGGQLEDVPAKPDPTAVSPTLVIDQQLEDVPAKPDPTAVSPTLVIDQQLEGVLTKPDPTVVPPPGFSDLPEEVLEGILQVGKDDVERLKTARFPEKRDMLYALMRQEKGIPGVNSFFPAFNIIGTLAKVCKWFSLFINITLKKTPTLAWAVDRTLIAKYHDKFSQIEGLSGNNDSNKKKIEGVIKTLPPRLQSGISKVHAKSKSVGSPVTSAGAAMTYRDLVHDNPKRAIQLTLS